MRLIFAVSLIFMINQSIYGDEMTTKDLPQQASTPIAQNDKADEATPAFLYKVVSAEDWKASQTAKVVKLPSTDSAFIHLAKFDQLDRVLTKYWADVPEFVVLKVDTTKLPGKLVFETNPGNTNKYYHLYNGSIPLDAVVDSKVFKSAQSAVP